MLQKTWSIEHFGWLSPWSKITPDLWCIEVFGGILQLRYTHTHLGASNQQAQQGRYTKELSSPWASHDGGYVCEMISAKSVESRCYSNTFLVSFPMENERCQFTTVMSVQHRLCRCFFDKVWSFWGISTLEKTLGNSMEICQHWLRGGEKAYSINLWFRLIFGLCITLTLVICLE